MPRTKKKPPAIEQPMSADDFDPIVELSREMGSFVEVVDQTHDDYMAALSRLVQAANLDENYKLQDVCETARLESHAVHLAILRAAKVSVRDLVRMKTGASIARRDYGTYSNPLPVTATDQDVDRLLTQSFGHSFGQG